MFDDVTMINPENPLLDTDSYKYSHPAQYPDGTRKVSAYVEARKPFGDLGEVVFFGLQAELARMAVRFVTPEDVAEAAPFLRAHGLELEAEGWGVIAGELGGRLPVLIEAVPEGTRVPVGVPQMRIVNTDERFPWLPAFLETRLLRAIWYPSTVATVSASIMRGIRERMLITDGGVEGSRFKLHDFGARGASSRQTAAIGGAAHLVSSAGTDTVSALVLARNVYGAEMAGFSIPACYDDQTEILSGRGFVPFSSLTEEDVVAEYRPDGSAGFVRPTAIIRQAYRGEMIRFRSPGPLARFDLLVTPNHRMVRRSKALGTIEIRDAVNAEFSLRNVIPMAARLEGDAELGDVDRLRIAFQADGSFVSRRHRYTGRRTGTIPVRFGLQKQRKKDRLEALLARLGVNFSKTTTSNRKGYVHYWCPLPVEWVMSKTFDWVSIENKSERWARDFMEEVAEWDGKTVAHSVCYSTVVPENADVVQMVAVMAGMRASKSVEPGRDGRQDIHNVIACSRDHRIGKGVARSVERYDGFVHCVSVPSGMIIVRRNGCVCVCGNSEHSTMTALGREGEADQMERMLDAFPTGIVACVSDSYDLFRAIREIWGDRLRDRVLSRDGVLVVRPDSGDPVRIVPEVVEALMDRFGFETTATGYRLLNPKVRVIQGDGINAESAAAIMDAMMARGLAIGNVAFGMGGMLLQGPRRDDFGYAMKASAVLFDDGWCDVFKDPVTAGGSKTSKRGVQGAVAENGRLTARRASLIPEGEDALVPAFRDGEIVRPVTLDEVRARAWPEGW